MTETETRSWSDGCAQEPSCTGPGGQGVGGRGAPIPPRFWGGGYPDNCTSPEVSEKNRDPRLDELADMGMPRVWLEVAEAIGVDAFLAMWRILDREQSMHADSESLIEVRLRRYRSYQRYARNRYVENLFRRGHNAREIQHLLQLQMCETTCISNILRLRPKR